MNRSDLKSHIVDNYGITPESFERLFEEFAAYFDVTVEEFVRRRHLEMQKAGARNESIYAALMEEAREMRFAVRGLSERQVRRLIYG